MSVENDPRTTRGEDDISRARPERGPGDGRTVPDLIADLLEQVSSLVRTEVALVKAELRENFSRVGSGAMEIGAGAMIIQAALIILLIALVHAIEALGLGFGWASLIVGVVFAAIGALLLKRGKDNMSPSGLAPDRAQHSLQKDVRLVKEEVR